MFKKRDCVKTSKTNRNAQFYIGAAVGITGEKNFIYLTKNISWNLNIFIDSSMCVFAVGLCVGKLLSSPAINKTGELPSKEHFVN